MIAELRRVTNLYPGRLLIGEIYLPPDRLMAYYGDTGVQMPFNFQLLSAPWNAVALAGTIEGYERQLPPGAWPNWVLGNHDQPRIATRVGAAQARVAAMLLLTLRGTPTIYYGDEIGMMDVDVPPEARVDPAWHDGSNHGRDPQRTPMQWQAGAGAGFTTGAPWLPISSSSDTVNVARQRGSPESLLMLYRNLIALRRVEPALAHGSYRAISSIGNVLSYERSWGDRRVIVALNLASETAGIDLPVSGGRIVLSTRMGPVESVGAHLALRADEGVILVLGEP